jgi:hypothetical protein
MIDWILRISGLLGIVWSSLSYFDLMPYYQIKLYPVNSLTPRINLFPGEKIRLDVDFHDASNKDEIKSIAWKISDAKTVFKIEGQSPTFKLPSIYGGIYTLETIATYLDNSSKYGFLNFYVVQDKPEPVRLCRATNILINKHNTNSVFLNTASSSGAELYIGDNSWVSIKNEKQADGTQSLKLDSGKNLPLYNGHILVRAKGNNDKILNYEFFPLPQASFDCGKQETKRPAA